MPNALGFFMGYSHNILDKTKEEYSIIEELNVGKKDKFMEYLYKKRIRAYWLEDLQEFITKEKQVYIIRPPIDLMRQTMQKIQRTTELTYFEFYIKSCDLLGLSETVRVLSPNEFRNLAEKIMHAREVIRKKNGFR
jgi:RecG-like helicase